MRSVKASNLIVYWVLAKPAMDFEVERLFLGKGHSAFLSDSRPPAEAFSIK
jgi:hypothetical protein